MTEIRRKVVVFGGGPGGLSVGWMLARTGKFEVTVLEKESTVGGISSTFSHGPFLLDYGPHKAYSTIDGILPELIGLMQSEFVEHEKRQTMYLFESYVSYPVKMGELLPKMGFRNFLMAGFSAVRAFLKANSAPSLSYKDYIVSRFGEKMFQLVFESLAEKVWGNPSTLSSDIARTRIPSKNAFDTALRAVGLLKESGHVDAKKFYYPKKGFGRICERMKEEIEKLGGKVLENSVPCSLEITNNTVSRVGFMTNDQRQAIPCDMLISAIPIRSLLALLESKSAPHLMEAMDKVEFRSSMIVYLFMNQASLTKHHWIFSPDRSVVFSRIAEQKNMSEVMCPDRQTVISCDFNDYSNGPLWNSSDEQLVDVCIKGLERMGVIRRNWVFDSLVKRLPDFYPRYDLHYRRKISSVFDKIRIVKNILLAGRSGFYNYNNLDHCLDMGKFISDNMLIGTPIPKIWDDLFHRVQSYRIVD